jgi:hypothetical protein
VSIAMREEKKSLLGKNRRLMRIKDVHLASICCMLFSAV